MTTAATKTPLHHFWGCCVSSFRRSNSAPSSVFFGSSVSRVVAEMGAQVLFAAALLLLATSGVLCMMPTAADREACTKEAVANSSVSEEDRMKTQQVIADTFKEMREKFKHGSREKRNALTGRDIIAEKVDANEGIKDKEAAKKYARAFKRCLMHRPMSWDRIRCQAAKDANKDRLTDEDLRKMMGAVRSAYRENKGQQIPDDILEKKLGEALESEDKGKAALEVHKAINECWKNKKGRKPDEE